MSDSTVLPGTTEQKPDAADTQPYSRELAPGVHAYVQPDGGWCLNNAGWVTDGHTTLLIDSAATERRASALRDAVTDSGAPLPTALVNTHHHGDHTYGNSVFTPAATVLGHTECRRETLLAGTQLHGLWPEVDFGDITVTAPAVTYSDELTFHTGGIEARLIHPGIAHTTGDTVVWLPEQGVVFTGDIVFNGGTPFVPMGSLSGSLLALDRLRALGAHTVVPGHGPVTGPEVYDTVEHYLRHVGELARSAHARGLTPLEAAQQADLGRFAQLAESERLVANLHRAYAELENRPLGEALDIPAVWHDMMVMNGGRPVACHA